MIGLARRLRHDRRGAALMEFGLIAPIFTLVVMGMLDIGHSMYVNAVLQGAVQKAGRDSMLQTGPSQAANLDAAVWGIVRKTVPNGNFTTTRRAYKDFSNINKAEPFVDSNGNGIRNSGECFQDINGNGVWDTDASTVGQGGATDAVVYTATVSFNHMFPLPSLLNMFPGAGQPPMSPITTLSASTVLRNQPFDSTQPPLIIC